MNKIKISVVIPTYNREKKVLNTIKSVIKTFNEFCEYEIIVVDDNSSDNTLLKLNKYFNKEINSELIKIFINKENLGVTGSRNIGFFYSKNSWVFFLDSDDELLSNNSEIILNSLNRNIDSPMIFFRCIDEKDNFVGTRFDFEKKIEIFEYIEKGSYGEILCVINKSIVNDVPFEEKLRGYEGLSLARIINKYGFAILSDVVARLYNCDGDDRLSVSSGFLRRMPLLSKGHFLMLKEFGKFMTLKSKSFYFIKAMVYYVVGNIYYFIKGRK
ncbi:glycosyltransferase family 2 protein [Aliarcobacter butzleri]|uniref:glycosyltransferase family 2 protein n=1 Tax=Aliarcobacter butzleri TaxID=28197 RepID=UPI00125EF3C3|nr:glycosyltransferase family 2 protein [Aliarcobacter butzleri]